MSSTFIPGFSYIDDISREVNAVVTFSADHDFTLNEIVSFRVSKDYGMVEMNNRTSKVLDMTADTITTSIDSREFTPFSSPIDLHGTTPPVCVPSASGVDLSAYVPTFILTDAFDNVRS